MNIIDELVSRNILYDVTNKQTTLKLKGRGVYTGFDPTAPSLHLGNYIQILNLLRFKKAGYKSYAVLGGATAMIGDPSGKKTERVLLSQKNINFNKQKIASQLSKFGIPVIDNYEFYSNMNVLYFLRHVGKLLNINYMINKDIVKSRLDSGISFTEFSYQLIQGWDFYTLYKKHDIAIQLGGSDQWGNITSGLEIIRKVSQSQSAAAGLTTKLLIKSDGSKFGKTSDGKDNIWLDEKYTSSFKLYQYLLNQPDSDVEMMLKWLTFMPLDEINNLMNEHKKSPYLKLSQKLLAEKVTKHLRGEKAFDDALLSSEILFSKIKKVGDEELSKLVNDISSITKKDINILDALVKTGLSISKREAREFIKSNSVSVNGVKITKVDFIIKPTNFNKKYSLIKCGKRKNALIILNKN